MIGTSSVPFATLQNAGWLVFIASDGTTCVLWCDGVNQCFSYTSNGGATWTKNMLVAGVNMGITGARSGDTIHTITGSDSDITYRPLLKSGPSWSVGATNQIASTPIGSIASYQLDPQNRHWLLAGGPSPYTQNNAWYSATPTSGLWTPSRAASQSSTSLLPVGDEVGGYLLTFSYNGSSLQYSRIANSGVIGSWSTLTTVSSIVGVYSGVSNFQMLDSTRGLLVYTSSSGIYASTYTVSSDTWGASTQLSSALSDVSPTLVCDGLGHAWAVWCQYITASNYALVYKKFNGLTWDSGVTTLVSGGANITNPNGGYGAFTIGVMYTVGTSSPYTIGWASFASQFSPKSFMGRLRMVPNGIRKGMGRLIADDPGINASDTFIRANQSHWGTASDGHVWGSDASSNAVFSIASNIGLVTNSGGTSYSATLGPVMRNGEIVITGKISAWGGTPNFGPVLRWQSNTIWYKAYIDGTTAYIQKNTGGGGSNISTAAFAAATNTNYTIKFQVMNTVLRMRVWATSTQEPNTWTVSVTDASITTGYAGIRMCSSAGTISIASVSINNTPASEWMGRVRIYAGSLKTAMGRMRFITPLTQLWSRGRVTVALKHSYKGMGRLKVRASSYLKFMGRLKIIIRLIHSYQGRIKLVSRRTKIYYGRLKLGVSHLPTAIMGRMIVYSRRVQSAMGRVSIRGLITRFTRGRLRLTQSTVHSSQGRVRAVYQRASGVLGRVRVYLPIATLRASYGRMRAVLAHGASTLGRARVVVRPYLSSMGRLRVIIRRLWSSSGRLRLTIPINHTSSGRIRLVYHPFLKSTGRMRLGLSRLLSSRGRLTLYSHSQVSSSGRARFASPKHLSLMGRFRVIAQFLTKHTYQGRLRMVVRPFPSIMMGRVRSTLRSSHSMSGRAISAYGMGRSGHGRIRVGLSRLTTYKGRVGLSLRAYGSTLGRLRTVIKVSRSGMGRVRLYMRHASSASGRMKTVGRHVSEIMGRVRLGIGSHKSLMGRVRLGVRDFRSVMGRSRIGLRNHTSSRGRLRNTLLNHKPAKGRVCIRSIPSEIIVWENTSDLVVWSLDDPLFTYENDSKLVTWIVRHEYTREG